MKNIPIIIPVFNQLTYLKNIINWWKWYCPENPIYIIDNGSTYQPLLDWYKTSQDANITTAFYPNNTFIPNLKDFLLKISPNVDYYVISDPDIMPHPNTPVNFLEIWKEAMERMHLHRIGFGLITKDLPDTLNEKAMIVGNEAELLVGKDFELIVDGIPRKGYKAPIDTTFCLYKTSNGGWSAPMNGSDWGNCVRMFEAFHLGWYIDGEKLNDEMKFYFETSKYRVPGEPSAGSNNNRPKQYQ